MMRAVSFAYPKEVIKEHEICQLEPFVHVAHQMIHEKTGVGREWLGWVDWPQKYNKEEFLRIQEAGMKIRSDSDVLIVVGIGGSYLGAKAVIEMLSHPFYNHLPAGKRVGPEIYFVGQHLSADYISGLLELIMDKEVSINVISKSGSTMEPAIAFRIFREFMKNKYGKEMNKRIYATTDRVNGALRKLADEEGYQTFEIPDNIGGRYSIFTAVGLLPIAAAGIDIEEMMLGCSEASRAYASPDIMENDSYLYASVRTILSRKGKGIELFVNYEPRLTYLAEWWKQLFGESEGKDGKGIFPASVNFTTDLHSMGQYIQEGMHHFFETVLFIEQSQNTVVFPREHLNQDGLNYLAGVDLDAINSIAFQATLKAHMDGGIPVAVLKARERSPYMAGGLIYFFQKACAISGYLMGINPFDQPGVEVYKKNMFDLLGRIRE